ncbi:MAG: sigma-54 dependent transcriptional regulator [Deltaproteobacteria bacterium]|nr:sigma-54 dependent transcriptional regulator [Deltaproteobacteria bacterium]
MPAMKLLIVDDEAAIRFGVRDFLGAHGFEVEEATSCTEAVAAFRQNLPDVALVDFRLPDGTALELLPRLKEIAPEVPVAILTAHGSIDLAVRAIKEGAEQFLTKPVELPALLVILRRLLEHQRVRQCNLAGQARQTRAAVDPFLGAHPTMRQLAEDARRVAATDRPVLIQGETGSGKGVLANWLHRNGPRADEAFVDLNCAGLGRELLESELFGHEKGAFTGAQTSKPGLLEVAHRGSVFLDEVGDMDPLVQPKLLKVLEDHRFRRLGSVTDRRVDIRLISATHQDLARFVQEQRFRSDLFFRISTLPLRVPPLRARREDIPLLAAHLLESIGVEVGRIGLRLAADAQQALQAYDWPGNVRELRNVLERAALLSEGESIDRRALHFDAAPSPAARSTALTLDEVERQHIEAVLGEEDGNVPRAALRLGIPKSTLYQRIKKYALSFPAAKKGGHGELSG